MLLVQYCCWCRCYAAPLPKSLSKISTSDICRCSCCLELSSHCYFGSDLWPICSQQFASHLYCWSVPLAALITWVWLPCWRYFSILCGGQSLRSKQIALPSCTACAAAAHQIHACICCMAVLPWCPTPPLFNSASLLWCLKKTFYFILTFSVGYSDAESLPAGQPLQ